MSDAITTGVADVSVPFFVTVIFFFSYLLWAKFLHGGRLRINFNSPQSVDDVAAVLLIFTSFLLTFLELPLALAALGAIHDLDIGFPRLSSIWTSTTTIVFIFGCVAILGMLGIYWRQPRSSANAWEIFRFLCGLHLAMVGTACGLFAWTLVRSTPYPLSLQLFYLLLGVSISSYVSCVPIIFLSLRSKTKRVKYGKTIVVLLLLGGMVLGIVFGLGSSPQYEQGPGVITAYSITDRGVTPDQSIPADALTEIPVNVTSTGWLPPVFNLIAIDYDSAHIEHRDGTDYPFSVLSIDNHRTESPLIRGSAAINNPDLIAIDKQGFSRILDYNNQSIILWLDKDTLRAANTSGVALQAPVPVVLNSSQYNRTPSGTCDPTTHACIIDLNISNRLPVRVIDRQYVIGLLHTLRQNTSACQFTNITYDIPGLSAWDRRGITADCTSGECDVESHLDLPDVNLQFDLTDGLIILRYASMGAPVDISVQMHVQC